MSYTPPLVSSFSEATLRGSTVRVVWEYDGIKGGMMGYSGI